MFYFFRMAVIVTLSKKERKIMSSFYCFMSSFKYNYLKTINMQKMRSVTIIQHNKD